MQNERYGVHKSKTVNFFIKTTLMKIQNQSLFYCYPSFSLWYIILMYSDDTFVPG